MWGGDVCVGGGGVMIRTVGLRALPSLNSDMKSYLFMPIIGEIHAENIQGEFNYLSFNFINEDESPN